MAGSRVSLLPDPSALDRRSIRWGSTLGAAGIAAVNAPFILGALVTLRSSGAAVVAFCLAWAGAAVLGGAAIGIVTWFETFRLRMREGASLIPPLLGILVAAGLPALAVVLLRQTPSPYWYDAYLWFLPSSLVIGGHIALVAPAFRSRRTRALPALLAVLGIAGAAGTLATTIGFVTWVANEDVITGVGFALASLGIACDLGLFIGAGY